MRRKKLAKKKAVVASKTPKKVVRSGLRWLDCKECGNDGAYCAYDVKAVTCALCVAKQAAPPEPPKSLQNKPDEKRPRGWQFMKEYISPSGKVYHKGKEVDENTAHAVRTVGTKKGSPNAGRKRRGPQRKTTTKRGRKPNK